MTGNISDYLQVYLDLGLTFIPLKPRSKEPLVKWGNGCNPTLKELKRRARQPGINWGIRCGAEMAALDFDTENALRSFIEAHFYLKRTRSSIERLRRIAALAPEKQLAFGRARNDIA